ncbi:MAG: type II toxin-antitoxin system PemK/MazF family toxin [Abitibacteriaceae bacterium]|nr:type II toxin-antitoxin system PemK/MazF family toxin [Abditibacteriaceae bacterium]
MGAFIKGDVVVAPFPFSDLSGAKRRPLLVLAELTGDDVIVCQITSQAKSDAYVVSLSAADFTHGGLRQDSNVRPNRIFTADSNIIVYRAGVLAPAKVQEVIHKIVQILS